MTAKTYQVFNTFDDEGNEKKYHFDVYLNGDLPKSGGGVYIFAKNFNNIKSSEYYHISSIPKFSMIFDEGNIMQLLKKYKSNSVLIYECDNIELMDNIVCWIKKSHNFQIIYDS